MRTAKKIRALLCLLAIVLQAVLAPLACAEPPVPDLDAACSIRILVDGAAPSAGVALYRVAELKLESGVFLWSYTEDYALCGISTAGLENNANAQALARYTEDQSISGTEMTLDSEGAADFAGLSAGLYLLVQTTPQSGYRRIAPLLLPLPFYSEPDGIYLYHVTAAPKTTSPPSPGPVPPGTTVPTVPDLPEGDDEPDEEPKEDPDNPQEPPDNEPDEQGPLTEDNPPPPAVDEQPEDGTVPATDQTKEEPSAVLPNTGQLWWPVPVLAICGLLLLLLSCILLKRRAEDA